MNGAGGTNDCIAYINKIAHFGAAYSPGQVIISAHAGGYSNTNYYVDDVRIGNPGINNGIEAEDGIYSVNPAASITYTNMGTNDYGLLDHLTDGVNVAAYFCWGAHSLLGMYYPINTNVNWSGTNNGWWVIKTMESFNGMRDSSETTQANFLMWFSSEAFGGINYTNTPVGAVCYTDEPSSSAINDFSYYSLWESGKCFSLCIWNSLDIGGLKQLGWTVNSDFVQGVGDPFVKK